LFLEQSPSKVKLSPDLAVLLNLHTETRPRIIMSLWQYIKVPLVVISVFLTYMQANRLLDANDRKTITNDASLKKV